MASTNLPQPARRRSIYSPSAIAVPMTANLKIDIPALEYPLRDRIRLVESRARTQQEKGHEEVGRAQEDQEDAQPLKMAGFLGKVAEQVPQKLVYLAALRRFQGWTERAHRLGHLSQVVFARFGRRRVRVGNGLDQGAYPASNSSTGQPARG
jgi:hypothetical protein